MNAGSRKLCLLPASVLFPLKKKLNGQRTSQEIKPENGIGGKETDSDETDQ